MKKIFFIGIAGKTMAPLAKAFRDLGWEVLGSDQGEIYPPISDYLKENDLKYFSGYNPKDIPLDIDIAVVGRSALLVNNQNPQYLEFKKRNIPIYSYPEILNNYLIKENSIVVAGTYGKTTISSLVTWTLISAKINPSYMVGGVPISFSDGVKITDSDYSVVEGDETPAMFETDPPKFMFYKPKYLVLTSTVWDHPEIFKTENEYINAFEQLVDLLPNDGLLIYNLDSVNRRVVQKAKCRKISYSLNNKSAEYNNLSFETLLLGKSNLENIIAAFVLCKEIKINEETIINAIKTFKGIKTRLELLGKINGRYLYWDLAQHPKKVEGSLSALRQHYPANKIICIYDPSTTGLKFKESLNWIKGSFDNAGQVIVGKVSFLKSVLKEERVTGRDIVDAITKTNINVFYEPVDENIITYLKEKTGKEDIVVFMSSGGKRFTELIEKTKFELGKEGPPRFAGEARVNNYDNLIKFLGEEKVRKNVLLKDYTTLKIGGPADLFYETETEKELIKVLGIVRKVGIPYFVLGGGSNILVGDKGFRGIVIKVKNNSVEIEEGNGNSIVKVESGCNLPYLINWTKENNLSGLEFLAGIPGTIGGGVYGNCGAWNQSIGEKIISVEVLNDKGEKVIVYNKECNFSYRDSCFKHNRDIVLSVKFQLEKKENKEIEKDINTYLEKRINQPKEPSAGCVFINPKPLSAGSLIEKCGLKGFSIGGAEVSEKHANFIINKGGATADDVIKLSSLLKQKVKEKFNIELIMENILTGEFNE